jgi:hypothetical protein
LDLIIYFLILDYEDNSSSITTLEHISTALDSNNSDESDDDEDEDEDDDDDDDDGSSGDEETISDDESHHVNSTTIPCTIIQRRHSDTIHTSYGTPIIKRRCTYSSMHDDEQKRSVLVESYRKLRGIKKPKLQVSLLICNLIKRLEKTFTKTPPIRQEQEQEHLQYYQHHHHHRTTYRSTSSDSIYMSPLSSTLVNDEIEITNQQYSSSSHSSTYESNKVLLPVNDLRSSSSTMYHPSSTDAYWLAQSNFAVPVVSTSDDDDVDVSLHGGGDYLDLSDNTLSSSSSSNDCCCSSSSSSSSSSSPSTTITKLLVDTNNNNNNNDYYIYHHHPSSTTGQTFFYPHNGNNTVDIITTA